MGFPDGSAGKESACNAGDLGSVPGLGRSPGEWKGYPLQYSGLENSIDCIVHEVRKSQTRLSDFHFRDDLKYPSQELKSTEWFGTSMSARHILEVELLPRVGLFAH